MAADAVRYALTSFVGGGRGSRTLQLAPKARSLQIGVKR